MTRRLQISVIGAGEGDEEILRDAEEVGRGMAEAGAVLVCGGLGGVMEAASRGASEAGGAVFRILPTLSPADANPYVTHAVATGTGHARNLAVVASGEAVIAVGGEWERSPRLPTRASSAARWSQSGVGLCATGRAPTSGSSRPRPPRRPSARHSHDQGARPWRARNASRDGAPSAAPPSGLARSRIPTKGNGPDRIAPKCGPGSPVSIGSGGCSVPPETEATTRAATPTATMLRVTTRTLAFAPPGEVAQLVEHTTENRGVGSSILPLAIA